MMPVIRCTTYLGAGSGHKIGKKKLEIIINRPLGAPSQFLDFQIDMVDTRVVVVILSQVKSMHLWDQLTVT